MTQVNIAHRVTIKVNSHNVTEIGIKFTFIGKSPAEEVPDALYISVKVPAHKKNAYINWL